ncbi:hypothetical protein TBLA_0B09290 [Henningerozyma blattae CBS 6284]|uniref:Uncharacterized protein n=1 Tax=Henningerozyma blattae (strain ATCC 34711 / CBS 6284 / DSM 70876 / NBRC 10599 / NRRL Y-10934 / UCD 77-7) TaxID=1071380 RepID=I2H044_HENB6|nr:hypothetical protein TBLA_0B09290 [Tetrapisispora blattae CBS 6284]CCH59746.1 hypothetical protein TBLA_0B09290 [Tetrapisispora blattae CBS 6284]
MDSLSLSIDIPNLPRPVVIAQSNSTLLVKNNPNTPNSTDIISNPLNMTASTMSNLVSAGAVAASSVTGKAASTMSNLVSTGNVAASSVTSKGASTISNLVSNGNVAASSVNAKAGNATTTSKNAAAAGMVANPISWKYGVAIGIAMIGSLIFGAEL